MSHVLVVDDTPENLWLMVEALKGEHHVMVARDGMGALKQCEKEPKPDIILLDVKMPEICGYEVCRRLKENPLTAPIPVIFVTSLADAGGETKGIELGAVDYIHKPFDAAVVRARVKAHVENKFFREQLEQLVQEKTNELLMTQLVTIRSLAVVAEWRDPETGGHIWRTQNYVKILADTLLDTPKFAWLREKREADLMYESAPLHDIGKVSIPDRILLKPDRLTSEEFDVMKQHATFGDQVLTNAEKSLGSNSFLKTAREIAVAHHERWDGSGYPNKLRGDEIPLAARIMSVADVYDALISKRVYKAAVSHDVAMQMIMEGDGTQFDPDVVGAFVKMNGEFRKIAEQNVA